MFLICVILRLQERRFKSFQNTKKDVMSFFKDLDRTPQSDFEREIVCEDDIDFQLTEQNLNSLENLKTEVCTSLPLVPAFQMAFKNCSC